MKDIWAQRRKWRKQGRRNIGVLNEEQKADVQRMIAEGLSALEIQRRTLVSPRTVAAMKSEEAATGCKLYRTYQNMISRCENPKVECYSSYGAIGIKVCNRWRGSFRKFVLDVGEPPTPAHTLERIDNKKGYAPSNVRWATRKEQSRNRNFCRGSELKARAVRVLAKSEFTQSQIAELLDMNSASVSQIVRGMSWR